jgi:hypothetical protein
MSTPITLIQLISEQTMQNLLPILALKPSRVVHLATPKTAARSAQIIEAARQAQLVTDLEPIRLSEMPSISETSRAVRRSIRAASDAKHAPVINFTGGTKLMSIGAYEAAMRERAISLYVDTDHQQFVDGHTGPKLHDIIGDNYSFTPLQGALTVNAIAVAHGRQRVTGGRDWRPYLPLARYLMEHQEEERRCWEAIHGKSGTCPNGREPRQAADWLLLLDRPIALPAKVSELARDAGLVRGDDAKSYLPDTPRPHLERLAQAGATPTLDYFATVRPLQFVLAFFSGGWWEVVVAEAAHRSGHFRDLRWSVNVGERRGGYDPEEDIVGVDGVQIAFISCKRGGAKARLVPYLDELDSRARSIGGHFTRRFLAVSSPPQGRAAANLQKRASELGIRILAAADLDNPGAFGTGHPAPLR